MRYATSILLAALCACRAMRPEERRGAQAIARYGCGSCHSIRGITGAHGRVGPPLDGIGSRMYAAGVLPNTPDNLALWVQQPSAIKQTMMPDLGVSPEDAADIASYLALLK
jgi:cytochrome c